MQARTRLAWIVAILVLYPQQGGADAPVVPAVSTTISPDAAVPPLNCLQPVPPPRIQPDPQQVERFHQQMPNYEHCVQDYVAQRNATAKTYNGIAMQHIEAANAAVGQYNAFMMKLKADSGE